MPYEAGHLAAVQTLTEGLLRLGLLKGTLEKNLSEGLYQRFYRHKTGHWIGMDVHDVGDYRLAGDSRLLEPGMAFTIEPGLYIGVDDTTVEPRWRGIGIRTEDDVLITDDGHRVLTEGGAQRRRDRSGDGGVRFLQGLQPCTRGSAGRWPATSTATVTATAGIPWDGGVLWVCGAAASTSL